MGSLTPPGSKATDAIEHHADRDGVLAGEFLRIGVEVGDDPETEPAMTEKDDQHAKGESQNLIVRLQAHRK